MQWPWSAPVTPSEPQLFMRVTQLEEQLKGLEQRMACWITDAANIIDRLTSLEHRNRMREVRAAAKEGDPVAQGSLFEFKRQRGMRG